AVITAAAEALVPELVAGDIRAHHPKIRHTAVIGAGLVARARGGVRNPAADESAIGRLLEAAARVRASPAVTLVPNFVAAGIRAHQPKISVARAEGPACFVTADAR